MRRLQEYKWWFCPSLWTEKGMQMLVDWAIRFQKILKVTIIRLANLLAILRYGNAVLKIQILADPIVM